jgi:hypothetical protein
MATAMFLVALVALMKVGGSLWSRPEMLRRVSLATCVTVAIACLGGGSLALANDSGVPSETTPAAAADAGSARPSSDRSDEFSVENFNKVVIPPGRPRWIAEAKELKAGANWTAVVAGPCATRTECEQELSREVKKAADEYINRYLGSNVAAGLLNYDGAELRNRLVRSDALYHETIQVSFGPMEQLHARVEFDESFRRELDERWRQVRGVSRLAQVGLIGAVALGLLATAFGFFRANTATRGTRSTNLQFAAAATILVIVVAGVVAARYLYWL